MTYTSVATDSFTGTAATVLDSSVWTQVRDVAWIGSSIRYSNPTGNAVPHATETIGATGLAHASVYVRATDTYAQDQYAKITTGGLGANWGLNYKTGVALRCSTAQDTSAVFYLAYVCGNSSGGANNVCIMKTNGSTYDGTSLVNVTPTIAWADGDVFLFEAVGGASTVLTCYRAAAASPTTFVAISGATYTDSSSPLTTANRPALFLSGDDSALIVWAADWEGGNVTGASGIIDDSGSEWNPMESQTNPLTVSVWG